MKARLLIVIFFLVLLINLASAEQACCEKTTSGEYCRYLDVSECDTRYRANAATCEQTSYCKIGCCYSSDEGQCFKNTPEAACTTQQYTWSPSPTCETDACVKGCCTIGTESFFVTQTKCKQTTSKYPDVKMNFDGSITSEKECLDKSRSEELGCCVSEDTCTFTTRGNCNEDPGETTTENITERGFYKDVLCSNDKLSCGCAKQHHTECFGEDVYWVDSCGNRENIYDANKERSYNQGYVLPESQSCEEGRDCGNCNYLEGYLCGNASKEAMPKYGNLICINTECKDTYQDQYSPNSGGTKKSGESWCLYDSAVGLGRDTVGSLHYRALCINGEEIVESCRDFREEICIQGTAGQQVPATFEALGVKASFVEAACRENRNQDCNDCNDIDTKGCGADCDGLPDPNLETKDVNEAMQACCAKKCCEQEFDKDCYWLRAGISPYLTQSDDKIVKDLREQSSGGDFNSREIINSLKGVCVPQVPPGMRFWSEEVEPIESSTRSTTRAIFDITTMAENEPKSIPLPDKPNKPEKTGSSSSSKSVDTSDCAQGTLSCEVTFRKSGLRAVTRTGDYECVKNCHCITKDWVIAANNYCKALGDCGAYFNYEGDVTLDGYSNTASAEKTYFKGYKLRSSDVGDWSKLTAKQTEETLPSFMSRYFGDTGVQIALGIAAASSFPCLLEGEGIGGRAKKFTSCFAFGGVRSLFGTGPFDKSKIKELKFSIGDSLKDKTFSKEELGKLWGEKNLDDIITNYEAEKSIEETADGKYKIKEDLKAAQDATIIEKKEGIGGIAGIANTLSWFYLMYKLFDTLAIDEKTEEYTVTCDLWQPPEGGDNCEICNNPIKPCTEYKCKSLGQNCALVNKGTAEELCVGVATNDANSPIISPLIDQLKEGFTITRESTGYKINEKIDPFTLVTIGIRTNEPAQCRFSNEQGLDYDEMQAHFGTDLYTYNHTAAFILPGELAEKENLQKTAGGNYITYIRCKDYTGNKNERDYFIKFAINPTPDLTAPIIEKTSIDNGIMIPFPTKNTDFSIFVNEPASCKYSAIDQDYTKMENEFQCVQSGFSASSLNQGLYECKTRLTDIELGENEFFFKCKDKSNNINQESFKFTLTRTNSLLITSVQPSEETFFVSNITLTVVTAEGAEQGKATCAYETTETNFENMIGFINTGSTRHSQQLTLPNGKYTFHIACKDIAGNMNKTSTNFIITTDLFPPQLVNIYKDGSIIHLTLSEDVTCEYSIKEQFIFGNGTPTLGEGTEHQLAIDPNTDKYHIQCKDTFNNIVSFTVFS